MVLCFFCKDLLTTKAARRQWAFSSLQMASVGICWAVVDAMYFEDFGVGVAAVGCSSYLQQMMVHLLILDNEVQDYDQVHC